MKSLDFCPRPLDWFPWYAPRSVFWLCMEPLGKGLLVYPCWLVPARLLGAPLGAPLIELYFWPHWWFWDWPPVCCIMGRKSLFSHFRTNHIPIGWSQFPHGSDSIRVIRTDLLQMNRFTEMMGAMCDYMTAEVFTQIDSAAADCGAGELDDFIFPPHEFSAGGNYTEDYSTVWGFPHIDSAAVDYGTGAVELDDLIFRRTSFPTGQVVRRARWWLYMVGPVDWPGSVRSISDWVTPLRTSPRTCIQLFLLDISLTSLLRVWMCHMIVIVERRSSELRLTFAVHVAYGALRNMWLDPALLWFLIIWYCFGVFRVRAMASDRLPDREQAGPSYTPSGPLPGTFLGCALDIRSESCMSWRRTFQM